jgi:hypothetical protein
LANRRKRVLLVLQAGFEKIGEGDNAARDDRHEAKPSEKVLRA